MSALTIRQKDGERTLHLSEAAGAIAEKSRRNDCEKMGLELPGLKSTGELTVVHEPVVESNTQGEIHQIEKELSVVVDTDTVVNPRAMAERHCQSRLIDPRER